MQDEHRNFLKELITNEIAGKTTAIHAYDKMMWTVRSGFLTLVFAGWSLIIKGAVENKSTIDQIRIYAMALSGFSLALAVGAYFIDRNYARRKFRVIRALDDLMQIAGQTDFDSLAIPKTELLELLRVSGDQDNEKYSSPAYKNEMMVSQVIYSVPSAVMVFVMLYLTLK